MKNRDVGFLVIGIAVFIGFLVWLFNKSLSDIVNESCSHGPACPMWDSIWLQTNIGIGILVFVLLIGLYLVFFAKDVPLLKEIHKVRVVRERHEGTGSSKSINEHLRTIISGLEGDERLIYNMIVDSDGSIFQSELVKKTGHSKVKVTRILDRLEGKNIIERKRRGMTNIILLRHQ